MNTIAEMRLFKVSDREDDDCKIVPGKYSTWHTVDQMNYIQQQLVLSVNLLKAGAADDDTITIGGYVYMAYCLWSF